MLKRQASLILVIITILFCFASTPWAKANQPPVADAGPDQQIYLGRSTILQGSATDPDGDPIVSWFWTVESAPEGARAYDIADPYSPDPTFTPDRLGDYVLSLVVSDGIDWSDPDTVTIHVLENLPPVAVASADVTSGVAPLTVNFDGSGSWDPEGAPLTYQWAFADGSLPSSEVSPTHVYEEPMFDYLVILRVMDDFGQIDEDTILITVYEPTPESAIENLIADVESMNLQQGIDNSLDTKLTSALDALEALNADQRNDAVNKLNAFINEVEAQRGKKLTNEQADDLVAAAQEVISLIP